MRTQDRYRAERALAALDAEQLRRLVSDVLLELDEGPGSRLLDRLVAVAAKCSDAWVGDGPGEEELEEILSFANAAIAAGVANPDDVDRRLRRASDACHARDYETARQIFHALLPAIAAFDLDLGQHECVDEVLSVDETLCAAQYVLSVYMTCAIERRADALCSAICAVGDLGVLCEPLQEMEDACVELLPDLAEFLPRWRTVVEARIAAGDKSEWTSEEDRWLREVVLRMDGVEGLEEVARRSRRGGDLQAWCQALVEGGQWKEALRAYEVSADLVVPANHWRAGFLDGAALGAQELDRRDLPARLERAWQEGPTMIRLCRWIGTGRSKVRLRKLARQALADCPKREACQRSFLHLVRGEFGAAAKILAAAPGLGWSDERHPGSVLFFLFCELLGGAGSSVLSFWARSTALLARSDMGLGSLGSAAQPQLCDPGPAWILETAGVQEPTNEEDRSELLGALRKAAAKRVVGLTKNGRRKHYGHAAQLVAACAAVDDSELARDWLVRLREKTSRYPALQRELSERLGEDSA